MNLGNHEFKARLKRSPAASESLTRLAGHPLPLNGGVIAHTPVQRNNGIDAFLHETYQGLPIPVRVQRIGEPLADAACALHKAGKTKNAERMILIATEDVPTLLETGIPKEVQVVPSTPLSIKRLIQNIKARRLTR